MNEKWNEILSSLPPRPPRSRLEPYRELIEEMRRLGWTYREISRVLAEKCQLRVSSSNIHYFVRVCAARAKAKRGQVANAADSTKEASLQSDEVRQRIAAVKQRRGAEGPEREGFIFDPGEPLRLRKPDRKSTSS